MTRNTANYWIDLLIFILIFALSRAMPIMINWVNSNANNVHITQ